MAELFDMRPLLEEKLREVQDVLAKAEPWYYEQGLRMLGWSTPQETAELNTKIADLEYKLLAAYQKTERPNVRWVNHD